MAICGCAEMVCIFIFEKKVVPLQPILFRFGLG